jgi:hypothetical protein
MALFEMSPVQIEFSREEAELLCSTLRHHVKELDKEINRTESLDFKRDLQQTDRTLERILGRITAALAQAAS